MDVDFDLLLGKYDGQRDLDAYPVTIRIAGFQRSSQNVKQQDYGQTLPRRVLEFGSILNTLIITNNRRL